MMLYCSFGSLEIHLVNFGEPSGCQHICKPQEWKVPCVSKGAIPHQSLKLRSMHIYSIGYELFFFSLIKEAK